VKSVANKKNSVTSATSVYSLRIPKSAIINHKYEIESVLFYVNQQTCRRKNNQLYKRAISSGGRRYLPIAQIIFGALPSPRTFTRRAVWRAKLIVLCGKKSV
jgi:hypothetical protein